MEQERHYPTVGDIYEVIGEKGDKVRKVQIVSDDGGRDLGVACLVKYDPETKHKPIVRRSTIMEQRTRPPRWDFVRSAELGEALSAPSTNGRRPRATAAIHPGVGDIIEKIGDDGETIALLQVKEIHGRRAEFERLERTSGVRQLRLNLNLKTLRAPRYRMAEKAKVVVEETPAPVRGIAVPQGGAQEEPRVVYRDDPRVPVLQEALRALQAEAQGLRSIGLQLVQRARQIDDQVVAVLSAKGVRHGA